MSNAGSQMTDPIQPQFRTLMKGLAKGLDLILNGEDKNDRVRAVSFCLLTFNFADLGDDPGRINYISNAERADMITAIKEFLARLEGRVQETETLQ